MYGHPFQPLTRRGAARVLAERIEGAVRLGSWSHAARALGTLGLDLGQRVVVHGPAMAAVALGDEAAAGEWDLAVQRDPLGFVREVARRAGGTFLPVVHGHQVATLRLAGARFRVGLLEGGVLGFLARAPLTIDGLGLDLTEDHGLLDARGGLQDAARRRLVPGGAGRPSASTAVRALGLSARLGFELSPRLANAARDLVAPGGLDGVAPRDLWDALDPALARGASGAFRGGQLTGLLDAWCRARGLEGGFDDPPDRRFLEACDRIEAGLAARQVGPRPGASGCGLSAGARLLGLLALRLGHDRVPLEDPRYGHRALVEVLGRTPQAAASLARIAARAARLAAAGFPFHGKPPGLGAEPVVEAAAGLLTAALTVAAPFRADVARCAPDPVDALVRLLGLRAPALAA